MQEDEARHYPANGATMGQGRREGEISSTVERSCKVFDDRGQTGEEELCCGFISVVVCQDYILRLNINIAGRSNTNFYIYGGWSNDFACLLESH